LKDVVTHKHDWYSVTFHKSEIVVKKYLLDNPRLSNQIADFEPSSELVYFEIIIDDDLLNNEDAIANKIAEVINTENNNEAIKLKLNWEFKKWQGYNTMSVFDSGDFRTQINWEYNSDQINPNSFEEAWYKYEIFDDHLWLLDPKSYAKQKKHCGVLFTITVMIR